MKKGHLILLSILFIILSACSRYDNNPKFNLLSVKTRIVKSWELSSYISNGSDQTDNYLTLYPSYELDLTDENTYSETGNIPIIGTSWENTGDWVFSDDKSQIIFTGEKVGTYTITKLTSDELWYQEEDGNNVYEFHFSVK